MFVVTGGGSGIGRALAQALAHRGKRVLIIGRHESTLAETAVFSPLITYTCGDVAHAEDRLKIVQNLQSVISIEGLVHNAAIIEPIAPIASVDQGTWEQAINTNLNAPLFLTQLLLDKLKHGRVLHIGSGAAYFPVTGWGAYCVSKAALSMLTRCWQLESRYTAFSSVMPGIIDTSMQAVIREAAFMEPEKRLYFNELKEKGKLISKETVAQFLCWLLLDVQKEVFSSKEWDIYDKKHHEFWLADPHYVPELE